MNPSTAVCPRRLIVAAVLAFSATFSGVATAKSRSDVLLDIVTNCVNPQPTNYCTVCSAPRKDTSCGIGLACKKSTEVWALTETYTAIRDIKMCGCPADFVHGLAIPTTPVTGVEDPLRPDGIWQFAWDVAASRIEQESIALVVNPKLRRSQNQLHVHMLRLNEGARSLLERESPTSISDLTQVWATAASSALVKGLDDYGVIVAQSSTKDYLVVVTAASPESLFTKEHCD